MRKKLWHSLALVTLLTGGIAVLWGFFASWGISTYESHMRQDLTYEDLQVDARGDAWIQVNQYYNGNSNELQNQLPFRTLEGEPIEVPFHDFWLDSCSLGNRTASWIKITNKLQNDWQRRIIQIANTKKELWYMVHNGAEAEAGRAYLVGYNLLTKIPVGYCGRQGFRAELPTEDQWFRLDGRNTGWGYGNCAVISSQKDPKIALASQDGWFEFTVKQRLFRTIDDSQPYLSVSTCKLSESITRDLSNEPSNAALKSLRACFRIAIAFILHAELCCCLMVVPTSGPIRSVHHGHCLVTP